MTAGLGLAVYGAAVARSAFLGSAPIGIAAAVMAAVMSGERGAAVVHACRADSSSGAWCVCMYCCVLSQVGMPHLALAFLQHGTSCKTRNHTRDLGGRPYIVPQHDVCACPLWLALLCVDKVHVCVCLLPASCCCSWPLHRLRDQPRTCPGPCHCVWPEHWHCAAVCGSSDGWGGTGRTPGWSCAQRVSTQSTGRDGGTSTVWTDGMLTDICCAHSESAQRSQKGRGQVGGQGVQAWSGKMA